VAGDIDKVERLAKLVAALLHTDRPLTLREVVSEVEGYPPGAENARVAFERDKRELRGEGVDVELVEAEGDEPRYRIDPAAYFLPDLGLTDEETVALNVALSGVQVEGIDPESARWKLGPGPAGEVASGEGPLMRLPATPSLPKLHDAIVRRCPVTFSYGSDRRTVEPWGLLCRDGFWYLTGHDRLRDGERNFRVDRIVGEVEVLRDRAADFDPPPGFRPDRAVPDEPWQLGPGAPVKATVRADASIAERVEAEVGGEAVVERAVDGSIVVSLDVTSPEGLRSWLFGLLDHAVVLGPLDLRQSIIDELRAMASR
jgi:predicted DNA-binding transcriptional regulator YafY